MRTLRIDEGDIVIILKRRSESLVPLVKVEDHNGPLGVISRLSLVTTSDSFMPQVEVDVASDLSEEAWIAASEELKKSVAATVYAFKGFTGIKVNSPPLT
jgi:bifunctional DNA-binding transcriptional regulator/antitoxin component of YhaV-PrlF toxin-antitoxin module